MAFEFDFADLDMDRYQELFNRVVRGDPPLADETEIEKELRTRLEIEVAEMAATGQIPSFPFD